MFLVSQGQEENRVSGTFRMHPWVTLPVIDSNDALGGHYQVADITARNAIPAEQKAEGMLCTVLNAGSGITKIYQLLRVSGNLTWVELVSGKSGMNTGDMLYWGGTAWNILPVGDSEQVLRLSGTNTPTWNDLNLNVSITTKQVIEINKKTATCGGTVNYSGEGEITAWGVCWIESTNPQGLPTLENPHTTQTGTPSSSFVSYLTGLQEDFTYKVRAYVIIRFGVTSTVYASNVFTFTTLPFDASPPVGVTTRDPMIDYNITTAIGGGTVSGTGKATISARGICWGTSPWPTLTNSSTTESGSTGSFTSNMTGLIADTYYYVRAYATNILGTTYADNEVFFKTKPYVVTDEVYESSITTSSAQGGGTVSGLPGYSYHGLCWNTSANPTVDDYLSQSGYGEGSFIGNMTDLEAGRTYHVRAYATYDYNNGPTYYGNDVYFTTVAPPAVTTSEITSISGGTAKGGGIIYGLASDLYHGIIWGTNPNQLSLSNTDNFVALNGQGNGTFDSDLDNLIDGETYYVKAFAILGFDSADLLTAHYGNQVRFIANGTYEGSGDTQSWACGQTFSAGGITYSTATVNGKCWITQNLGASVSSEIGNTYQFGQSSVITSSYDLVPESDLYSYIWMDSQGGWPSELDPCEELGAGWRLPTISEWTSAIRQSSLHLCSCGYIDPAGVSSSMVIYWSSSSADYSWGYAAFGHTNSFISESKTIAMPVRCLKD